MKLHWFAYSFIDHNNQGSQVYASVYVGYSNKNITMGRMAEAKESAMVTQKATVLAVSYLGLMTHEEMRE